MSFFALYNFMFYLIFISFFLFFFLSVWIFFSNKTLFFDWEILNFMCLKISFPVYIDFMSSLFLSLIFLISSLVVLYSKSYMENDKHSIRFMYVLSLFIISMIFFIISPNLISMILGWDGLGLVSYCLIIHYQNFKSNSSGMLTALSNRIGDCFLIFCICYMMNFYSWNYLFLITDLNILSVCFIILLSITKSAQIPFSSWLPAAMAAPTPVSSLVHSSTLVTAGVFMLIRFSDYLFKFSQLVYLILIIGLLTTCMAGISANLEMDMKKIIALSTLSQLGVMMSSLSIGMKELTFFHLIMHALFKALMFMCSGNFIHMNFNVQDLRFYGLVFFLSPISSIMFFLSNLSLCGFPFLCGFFSKDLILEMVLSKSCNLFEFFLFLLGTSFTVMYTVRMLMFSMSFSFNYSKNFFLFDSNLTINFSMLLLFFFSICGGLLFSDIYLVPLNLIVLPLKLKVLVLLICVVTVFLSVFLNSFVKLFMKGLFFMFIFEFLNSMFFLTYMSKKVHLNFILNFSKSMNFMFSNGWIENTYGLMQLKMSFALLKILFLKHKKTMTNFLMLFLFLSLLIFFN